MPFVSPCNLKRPSIFNSDDQEISNGYNNNYKNFGNKSGEKYTNKGSKQPKNSKMIQFTIQILRERDEVRIFSVYQADSSEEAARKMVSNLRIDESQIPYWTAFIEERRLGLGIREYDKHSPSRSHNNYGKNISKSY